MNLYVDVGNTALKMALDKGDSVESVSLSAIPWAQIKAVVVGQVGKRELLSDLINAAKTHNVGVVEANVSPTLKQLKCGYALYQNLGIDRWLAVIACHYLYLNENVIIVDSGTATTVDGLTAAGQHLGGWIIPGLDMMSDSLTRHTQKVFSDLESPFAMEFGVNTPNAVKNGSLVSTLGCVVLAKSQYFQKEGCKVVFTGGYGALLQKHIEDAIFVKDLVLLGLKYWHQNQG
ncbi:type III pantothenate kinase [Pseudoalteromonas xiamenensis]|uniref:type III pantothenate kinase n=1 Tax=Pseudoalteromonas xiamenensis TaxID=882626 RepID=UPI0027E481E5|nr:type III pantothenate kinase [Pseudoalteromonas xiamenensis]WMN58483.1 type III pantothenate kinase [Pseudoalteromonas xiamenensis]